jgi:hypothetical protein
MIDERKKSRLKRCKVSEDLLTRASRANVCWGDTGMSSPMILETPLVRSSFLQRSNKATSASFKKRRLSLDGERNRLIGDDKIESLLSILRTNTFAGIIDPECHLQYFEPPLFEVRKLTTTKRCIGSRRIRSSPAFMKHGTK